MNILCTTYEYPPIGGGGSNVAQPLAEELALRGHKIDIVTSGMSELPTHECTNKVNIHRVACVRRFPHYATTPELFTYLWPAYKKARELCSTRKYDINHTHFALPSGVVSYMLYKKTGLPYVTTIHGSDIPGYNPDRFRIAHIIFRPMWRRIIANSAKIVAASAYLKKLIQSHIDVPVEVIRNGYAVDSDDLSMQKINRMLVVTRMFRRKGVQYFLDAIKGINHGWEIVIAGDGPYLPILKQQAERLDLNVKFVGFVKGDVLADLYASSKIFVFPSIQENFPVVLLEAMNAGCAIVTTSAEGCGEVIGDAGLVTTPGHPDEIRRALESLINDESAIAELSTRARRRIQHFSWPRIAKQYENEFQGLLTQQPVDAVAQQHAVPDALKK